MSVTPLRNGGVHFGYSTGFRFLSARLRESWQNPDNGGDSSCLGLGKYAYLFNAEGGIHRRPLLVSEVVRANEHINFFGMKTIEFTMVYAPNGAFGGITTEP